MNKQINVTLKIKTSKSGAKCSSICPYFKIVWEKNWDKCTLFGKLNNEFRRHKKCIQAEVKLKKSKVKSLV